MNTIELYADYLYDKYISYNIPQEKILHFISQELANVLAKEIIKKELWKYKISPMPHTDHTLHRASVTIVIPNSKE